MNEAPLTIFVRISSNFFFVDDHGVPYLPDEFFTSTSVRCRGHSPSDVLGKIEAALRGSGKLDCSRIDVTNRHMWQVHIVFNVYTDSPTQAFSSIYTLIFTHRYRLVFNLFTDFHAHNLRHNHDPRCLILRLYHFIVASKDPSKTRAREVLHENSVTCERSLLHQTGNSISR